MAAFEHTQGRPTDPARHALLRGRQGDPVVPSATDENWTADAVEAVPGVESPTGFELPAYSRLMARFVGERIRECREEFIHSVRIVGSPRRIAPCVENRNH